VTKIIGAIPISDVSLGIKNKRRISPDMLLVYPVAFFDGAAHNQGTCSGAGDIIRTSPNKVYKWFFNCGKGTNTKAELLGAWVTLYLADQLNFHKIQVLGDSKIIIEWLNQKNVLQVSTLEGWKLRIASLVNRFSSVQFFHIYREYNMEADWLSKKALIAAEGIISLQL
jgi:ribonuclease HI